MKNSIYNLISSILVVVDGGWVFIISLILEFALFLTVTLLTLLKKMYALKRRAWYFIGSLSVLALELVFLSVGFELSFFYATLFVNLLFWTVVVLLPERKVKIKENHRQLARFIDESVDNLQAEQEEMEKSQPITPIKEEPDCVEQDFELDFKHVKTVIQKLEYYPLTASDKKVVRELEDSIYNAENIGFTREIKNKINDGLGALLKIMSKYGV